MAGSHGPPHVAFLYGSEDAHAGTVVSFVRGGLARDERILVVTTDARWDAIARRLRDAGVNPEAHQSGKLVVTKPTTIIEHTIVDGVFQRARFKALIENLLGEAYPPHRIYGDAAGVLAGSGNLAASLALEQVCTDLATESPIQIFCGHDVREFHEPDDIWQLRSVINSHDHVVIEPELRTDVVPLTGSGHADRRRELVLLWEAHTDTRLMYAEALTARGYRVMIAGDAIEALTLGLAYRPDLFIFDVKLPATASTTALHMLKAARDASAPILALTAHAFEVERDRITAGGFDRVLSKPCLPDDLVAAVTNALDRPSV